MIESLSMLWPSLLGHAGEPHDGPLWLRWNFDPLLLTLLIVPAAMYAIGVVRLRSRTEDRRGMLGWQATAFAMGMFSLFVALISPLDSLSAELSSAHMVQHMVLMMIAAPLLVLGSPLLVGIWSLPLTWRQAVGRWQRRLEAWEPARYLLWQPALMWTVYLVTLWIWHIPALYHAALRNQLVHDFQHLTFLLAACLFWRVLLDPLSRLRMSVAAGVVYLFTTSLHATVLGVFMALSPAVWYGDYEGRTAAWGLTALEDQQLAGLIMWMPACMIYAIVAAVMFALWLHRSAEAPAARAQEVA